MNVVAAPSTPLIATTPVVDVRDVSFSFDPQSGPRAVLDRVSLTIGPRDFVGIIGPNGGGKTTLLRLMLGLLEPSEGTIALFGSAPRETRGRVGYVPQRAAVNANAPASVLDVVLMGRLARRRWGFRYRSEDIDAAMRGLERTGMEFAARRSIGALSGGQRQRVLIARALCGEAGLLLLDEPTAGVDAEAERSLTELLHRLNEELPIVIVTHDVAFVSTHVRSVACLNRALSLHRPQDVTGESLAAMYGGDVRMVDHHRACCGVEHEHSKPGA